MTTPFLNPVKQQKEIVKSGKYHSDTTSLDNSHHDV